MRKSGGKRLNSPKKGLTCSVQFLDDVTATYEIPKGAKGEVLFESVLRSLELNDGKYFGLLFYDSDMFSSWLDLTKKVKSQVKANRDNTCKLEFRVKHYVPDPDTMLTDELTRYQFVLQLKQDIFCQRLSCNYRTLVMLASYIVQSELGDYDRGGHKTGYLKEFKFIPNQPSELEHEITDLHKMHAGLTPEQVEMKYLEKVKWLEQFGVDKRYVKDSNGASVQLGIGPSGIMLYSGEKLSETFEWARITKLRFHQKKFIIKVLSREPGGKEQEYMYYVDKTKHCKLLWKMCLEHHGFYKSLPPSERCYTLHYTPRHKANNETFRPRSSLRDKTRDTEYTPSRVPRDPSRSRDHSRSRDASRPRDPSRTPTNTRRHPPPPPSHHVSRQRPYEEFPRRDNLYETPQSYYNSLPKQTLKIDSNRYQDKGYPEVNKRYVSATLSRPKSFGEHDMGNGGGYPKYSYHPHSHHQLHHPSQQHHHYPDNFKSFFTDTVLQQKLQYNGGYGKSWGTDVNYTGSGRPSRNMPYNTTSKSTGDIHSSHPAFITNSAMRQPLGTSFLMTTEL